MYSTLFRKVLYPLYESGVKRRKTLTYLDTLSKNQWLPKDQLESQQWQESKLLLNHCYQNSPYYRNQFKALNLQPEEIISYDDFRKFPLYSREDVVQNKESMIANGYENKIIHKSTGGSTGTPVSFGITEDSYEWRQAAAHCGYQWAKCEAGQPTVYIWGVDVSTPTLVSKIKTDLYHKVFNRKMFNCFNFNDDVMRQCLNCIPGCFNRPFPCYLRQTFSY